LLRLSRDRRNAPITTYFLIADDRATRRDAASIEGYKFAHHPDQRRVDTANRFLDIDIPQVSLRVEGLMSRAERERVWNNMHAEFGQHDLQRK
jgi:hypothetical protein